MKASLALLYLPCAVAAGIGTGFWLSAPQREATPAAVTETARPEETLTPLPADSVVTQLAALAGRTGEARAEIARLLASGASDEELAGWLAPVLISDPGWLEAFLGNVEPERRIALVNATIAKMGQLAPDSVWELVRQSPSALAAIRPHDGQPHFSFKIPYDCKNSPMAGEILFDPAFGFTNREVAEFFRHGSENAGNAARVLEEWIAGRWGDELPECIAACWSSLHSRDGETLRQIEARAPEELRKNLESFQAADDLRNMAGNEPDDLKRLGARELEERVEWCGIDGDPVPLSALAEVSAEVRGGALDGYFMWHYPFRAEEARAAIDSLDTLKFSPEEKGVLLADAAQYEWGSQGDIDRALELAARVPDPGERAKLERDLWQQLATDDPHTALERAAELPAGKLRDDILKAATDALP